MVSKKISYKNTALHYTVQGNGNVVMLLHGFAEDHRIWENQIEFLRQHFTVIAPDIFGSGESEMLAGENISLEDFALGIKEIITAENINEFVMIGHSMGGYITLAYHDLFPNDLKAMGLIHSTSYADDSIKIEMRNKAIQFLHKNGSAPFLKTSIPALFYDEEKNIDIINNLIKNAGNIPSANLAMYYYAMKMRPDRTVLLERSSIPTLFIGGLYDKAVPISHTLQQCIKPKIAQINILKNSAHFGMIEEPEAVNEILYKFLQDF